jgi:hypothetical protein
MNFGKTEMSSENQPTLSGYQQIIARAREIITDPDQWARYLSALDRSWVETPIESPKAYRFCATGALQRAAYELFGLDDEASWCLVETAERSLHPFIPKRYMPDKPMCGLIDWINYEHGHSAILEIFDNALASKPQCAKK